LLKSRYGKVRIVVYFRRNKTQAQSLEDKKKNTKSIVMGFVSIVMSVFAILSFYEGFSIYEKIAFGMFAFILGIWLIVLIFRGKKVDEISFLK